MKNPIAQSSQDRFPEMFSPAIRLLCAFLFAVPVSLLTSVKAALIALALAALMPILARIPIRHFLSRALFINFFVLFMWLTVPWATPGDTAFSMGLLDFSRAGLTLCSLITLKVNALFMVFLSLVSTLSLSRLAEGLTQLKIPDKLVTLLIFTSKGINDLEDQYRRLQQAAALRGFQPKTNLHTYRTVASFIGILLLRSAIRAEVLKDSLKLKGFRGKFDSLESSPRTLQDTVLLAATLLSIGLILIAGEQF